MYAIATMPTQLSALKPPHTAVVLINLGTPDAPTPPAVRRYLREFLSDTRVIEIPKLLWGIILNLFILPFRPKRVAEAYASIWDKNADGSLGDSPMRRILFEQRDKLAANLNQHYASDIAAGNMQVSVHAAMTYGNPNVTQQLNQLIADGVQHVIILPMFPQFSATTTAAVFDTISRWMQAQRNLPHVTFIKDYFANPLYIDALVKSIQDFQTHHGKPQKLLFSFHGIPQPYADKGDPYPQRCHCSAAQVAHQLGLAEDDWLVSFQSRFGKQEWVKPYTNVVLTAWGQQKVASVQVLSPAFSADCLETLEELAVENKHNFQQAGGGDYHYIPALNADDAHIAVFADVVKAHINAWQHTVNY